MKLVFSDSMSTEVNAIDDQHKAMFKMINEFQDSCNKKLAKEKIVELFDFLNGYINEHFTDEELFMESINYSELEEQREKHAWLKEQVKLFEEKLKNGSADETAILEFNSFLSDWLINHIIVEDTKFKLFKRL